mmetsp:Transcript_4173/g.7685  ORF Transcript_4173/g.7685 Transcript_4173/m.7685 type:complete len:230 (-) Transcript_4173:191-880(-)
MVMAPKTHFYMKMIPSALFASFLLFSFSEGFSPTSVVTTRKQDLALTTVHLDSRQTNEEECHGAKSSLFRRDFLALVGGASIGSMLTSSAPPASASVDIGSSSLYVADDIKTLDMSLPKYDSINTLKSSAESEKAMGVENPPEVSPKSSPAKKTNKSDGSSGSGGGNPLASVLPSMNKSVGKKPKPQKVEKGTRMEKEGGREEEYKTMDLSLPSYSENNQGRAKSAFLL